MLTYKAMYKFLEAGVHAEVLDFPGVITCAATLEEARRLLASALSDMAETAVLLGEPLPRPDPSRTDPEADLEEPIYLSAETAAISAHSPASTWDDLRRVGDEIAAADQIGQQTMTPAVISSRR